MLHAQVVALDPKPLNQESLTQTRQRLFMKEILHHLWVWGLGFRIKGLGFRV